MEIGEQKRVSRILKNVKQSHKIVFVFSCTKCFRFEVSRKVAVLFFFVIHLLIYSKHIGERLPSVQGGKVPGEEDPCG